MGALVGETEGEVVAGGRHRHRLQVAILERGLARGPRPHRVGEAAAEKLRDDCSLKSIAHYRKENAAVAASPELLDQIAQSADLVLTGSAD